VGQTDITSSIQVNATAHSAWTFLRDVTTFSEPTATSYTSSVTTTSKTSPSAIISKTQFSQMW
jgi:hypothetical protein